MRIFLIDPPGWQKHGINLGLAYLAGAIHSEGIEVQAVDMNNNCYTDNELQKIIQDYCPDLIGISVKTATANSAAAILKRLKNNFPQCIFVAGGPHISLCAEEFLKENPGIDFAVTGEGEKSFIDLIKNLSAKRDCTMLKGICYAKQDKFVLNQPYFEEDISALSFPRFEFFRDIDFRGFRYPLLTSRGCPFNCIFCCVGLISTKKWRSRNTENIIEEILYAKQTYNISSFEIMDDNFTYDIVRAKQICRQLIKRKVKLDWWCHNGLRADKLDRELLHLMKRSGCQSIALGIETGDEAVFRNIQKGESLRDIIKAVGMVKDAGIKCVGYFIIGLPGDSLESTKRTVRMQNRLKLHDYKYNMLVPYPGTKIWKIVHEQGRMLADIRQTAHFGDDIEASFETDELSKEVMQQCLQLVTDQRWVQAEKDLDKIQSAFRSRFQRGPEKIMVITESQACGLSKSIGAWFQGANIIEARLEPGMGHHSSAFTVKRNGQEGYFNLLFGLAGGQNQLSLNSPAGDIFIQNGLTLKKEEFISAEILPPVIAWDRPEGKYYATRLKHQSPDGRSAKNGAIYVNGQPLAFSAAPQWEKVACGKIESGIAFISLAAYRPKAIYTADYRIVKLDNLPKKIDDGHMLNGGRTILEKVFQECDILIFPEQWEDAFFIFSTAKMNIVYYKTAKNSLAFGYAEESRKKRKKAGITPLVFSAAKINYDKIKQPFELIRKVFRVFMLWISIISIVIYSNLKNILRNILR